MEEVYSAALEIKTAVIAEYAPYVNKPVRYVIQPGSEVEFSMDVGPRNDMCCNGSVVIVAGRRTFENLAQMRLGEFNQPFGIAVLRCAPQVDDMGNGPTDAQNESAFELYQDDAKVIRKAIRTWMDNIADLAEADISDYVESQISPQGGCAGTLVTFTIPISEDC